MMDTGSKKIIVNASGSSRFAPEPSPGKESSIPHAAPTKVDRGMVGKGYRYRLTARDGSIEPLYAKQIGHIGPIMRDYPNIKFDVHDMHPPAGYKDDYTANAIGFQGKHWPPEDTVESEDEYSNPKKEKSE